MSVRTDLDSPALASLAKGAAMGNHRGDVLGLTVANYAIAFESEQVAEPAGDGRWCARISRLSARLFLPETTVYVAAKYPRDSCPFTQILTHERQHVAITEGELQRAGPRLEQAMRRLAGRTLLVDTAEGAEGAIDEAVGRLAGDFIADLTDRAHRANLKIDDKANYRHVAGQCPKW